MEDIRLALIVIAPLIGAVASYVFGRVAPKLSGGIASAAVAVSLFNVVSLWQGLGAQESFSFILSSWLSFADVQLPLEIYFDKLSAVMCLVVTGVGLLIHLYSIGYMAEDESRPRFFAYLNLFIASMLILVLGKSLPVIFIGWEGVGLCSYLLIGFWFTNREYASAGRKAFVMNRIGDVGFIIAMAVLFVSCGTLDVVELSKAEVLGRLPADLGFLAGLALFFAATGKSAQIPLFTWLPDAMAGPTPVSALITAGVFLIARCSPLFEYAPGALSVVTIVGAMTAFFAASTGLLQNDMKRVIAYSTCSQLGYMVFACGLSNYHVGVFHLANHAFFKALLFLGAGCVIHAVGDEQDMRKMGGLAKLLPFTYGMMLIGSLSLMGMPFLTGFYSKDVILEVAYGNYTTPGHFAYTLGTMAAFLTAFYSMRLLYLTFLSKPNGFRVLIINAHEAPLRMALPLFILAIPSIFIGYLTKDMIIGLGTDFWQGSIFIQPKNFTMIDAEHIPVSAKLLPVVLSILGASSSYFLYSYGSNTLYQLKTSSFGLKLYTFLNRKWFFDKVYNEVVGQFFLYAAYHWTYKQVDRGLIESLGPFGLSRLVSKVAYTLKQLQTGFFYHYTLAMVISLMLFLAYFSLATVFETSSVLMLNDARLWFLFILAIFFLTSNFKKENNH